MIVAENRNEVESTQTAIAPDLIRQINEAHSNCERAAQSAVGHAVRCGELLLQAKAAVPHGEWLVWLAENTQVNERTAQLYMRLARELPKLDPSKAQRVADLPLREALRLIAGPHVPSDADLFQACRQTIEHVRELEKLCLDALQSGEGCFVPEWALYELVQETQSAWGERAGARLENATLGEAVRVQREAREIQNAAAQMTILAEMCLGALLNQIEAEQATDGSEAVSNG